MKDRSFYATGVINVLLAAALVTNAQEAHSSLQQKHNTIHDLNQTVDKQQQMIDNQQKELADQRKLAQENNDLTYKLSLLKEKREEDQIKFDRQLEAQNRLFTQKIEKLSGEKEQAKQSTIAMPTKLGESNRAGSSYLATYYDLGVASTGKRPGDNGYGITRSGRYVESGVTIAVDPSVIPLGSWVEVVYPDGRKERRRADDTGRLIKGHHIDIYVPDASGYGRDTVKVRVLSLP